jgi:hypothetical protein
MHWSWAVASPPLLLTCPRLVTTLERKCPPKAAKDEVLTQDIVLYVRRRHK